MTLRFAAVISLLVLVASQQTCPEGESCPADEEVSPNVNLLQSGLSVQSAGAHAIDRAQGIEFETAPTEKHMAAACQDLPDWADSDGDDCNTISSGGMCRKANQGNNKYWTSYGNEGAVVGAQQACCACGGGMRTSSGKMMQCIDYDKESNQRDMGITKKGHCFEKTDSRGKQFKKKGQILTGKMMFYGDSDIEYWDSESAFPAAINCGVGGSSVYEAALHAQKMASQFEPKGYLVLVAGENDMMSAQECAETLANNLEKTVKAFLDSRYHPTVIMLGTKPEPGTTELHSLYRKYDALAKALAQNPAFKGHFKFIDTYSQFMAMGNPGSLYQNDNLHMKKAGYAHWNEWLQATMKEGCHDQLASDGAAWKDLDGDTCATISSKGWCSEFDEYVPSGGVGANHACCECGGGCDDHSGWVDSDGDDCTKIVAGNQCQNADGFKVNGVGAKEACCGCGGGSKRQARL